MRKILTSKLLIFSLFLILINCSSNKSINTVKENGSLSVRGNEIVNKKGIPVSLAGNSFYWSNSSWFGHNFYNKDVVNWLKKDWNTTIIRCAISAKPNHIGGYFDTPQENLNRADMVIEAAIENGLYVIIDWHSHDAEKHEKEAINFFKRMATKYGKHPNIIYEIYNEPLNVSWDDVIKPYAENVIAEIRKIDANNLIIVGTPNWSQDVDIASKNPITEFKNIAYTLHFYAGSHKEELRKKTEIALANGIPIFVTEWGTVNANGNGNVDIASVKEWMNFMKKHNLSHCNWSINSKNEGASILKKNANINGQWKVSDLTPSGKLVRNYIRNWNTNNSN